MKIGGCSFNDFGLMNLCKVAPNVEHLELTRLETLGENCIKQTIKDLTKLKFIDLTGIKEANYKLLDELKDTKPNLLTKRFNIAEVDKKDNGLRVPRRVVDKKKKKKKGGKKKK